MKLLLFDYYMRIDYSENVSSCHFTIKCLPKDTLRQKVEELSVVLCPEVPYSLGEDSWGNKQFYSSVPFSHDSFYYRVTGKVRTENAVCEEMADADYAGIFKYPHGLNVAGDGLKAYYLTLKEGITGSTYDRGIYLMHRLYQDFCYKKGCTNMKTTAEDAWNMRAGVCQDYAHILVALLHMEGIPARYVTGMLTGEGESHAWVELMHEGGWYGLDPTNDRAVSDGYIRIGCGRDASDCLINRGTVFGGGSQTQTIQVSVTEKEE